MLKALIAAALLTVAAVPALAEDYVSGQHYQLVSPPQGTSTGDKVEVVELFWYGCPHCFQFEPVVDHWLENKPANVEFVRMPAVFARNWEVHARAYYACEQLGVLDKVHKPLFQALHVDKRRLFTQEELAAFFAELGVPEADFNTAYDSFDVDKKTRHAIAMTRAYGISGVPSLVVNGKYRSSAQAAGTYEDLLKVVDHLAAKESAR